MIICDRCRTIADAGQGETVHPFLITFSTRAFTNWKMNCRADLCEECTKIVVESFQKFLQDKIVFITGKLDNEGK